VTVVFRKPLFSPVQTTWSRLTGALRGESRRLILVSISSLAGGGLIALVLRFVGGMIQGRFVGPEVLGYYTKFTILPSYLLFLELGVFVSLARQYPYYIGKGDREKALEYASVALGWNNAMCLLHVVVFSVPCLWALGHGDWMASLGWGTQVVVAPTAFYMSYLGSTYRNSSEFVDWSKGSVIVSAVSLILLPLVMVWQFFGVCARNGVPNAVSAVYLHFKRPLRIRGRFDITVLKKMMMFGAPLMIFGYMSTSLWDALTRTYILKMMDEKALGVYAFAGAVCIALRTVATSISQVFHPRIAMLYGSSGKSIDRTFKYSLKCSLAGLAAILPLAFLICWLVDPLLRIFLPKYVESIPIARYLCLWAVIPVIDLPSQVLIVAKRTWEYGASVVIGFLVFLAALALYSRFEAPVTLAGIILAYAICKMGRVLIADVFAWRLAVRETKWTVA
jgi:O-antigen/teichoic acid export membrane protein